MGKTETDHQPTRKEQNVKTHQLTAPTLIALVGLPSSGKSTIARLLSEMLNVRHLDIDDDARTPYFGEPVANDGTDPAIDKQDRDEMAGAYDILFGLMQGFLHAGKSVITTCTLSSEKYGQRRLEAMFETLKAQNEALRLPNHLVQAAELSDAELQERIDERLKGGYTGATRSAERVRELEKRFNPIILPHLALNTAAPYKPGASAMTALEYIMDSQVDIATVEVA